MNPQPFGYGTTLQPTEPNGQGPAHLLVHEWGICFHTTTARLSSYDGDCMAHKTGNADGLSRQKMFPDLHPRVPPRMPNTEDTAMKRQRPCSRDLCSGSPTLHQTMLGQWGCCSEQSKNLPSCDTLEGLPCSQLCAWHWYPGKPDLTHLCRHALASLVGIRQCTDKDTVPDDNERYRNSEHGPATEHSPLLSLCNCSGYRWRP